MTSPARDRKERGTLDLRWQLPSSLSVVGGTTASAVIFMARSHTCTTGQGHAFR